MFGEDFITNSFNMHTNNGDGYIIPEDTEILSIIGNILQSTDSNQ